MFSSPEKQSPIKTKVATPSENDDTATPRPRDKAQTQTPQTATSTRRSARNGARVIPRSASPRKSGISGSARRPGTALKATALKSPVATTNDAQEVEEHADVQVDTPSQMPRTISAAPRRSNVTPLKPTNVQAATARPAIVRRFSPESTPLRNHVLKSKSAHTKRVSDILTPTQNGKIRRKDSPSLLKQPIALEIARPTIEDDIAPIDNDYEEEGTDQEIEEDIVPGANTRTLEGQVEENRLEPEQEEELDSESEPEQKQDEEEGLEPPPLPVVIDDEEEDQTFDPIEEAASRKSQNKANSRRKRRSDALEEEELATVQPSSPAAKRAKRISDQTTRTEPKKPRGRPPRTSIVKPFPVNKTTQRNVESVQPEEQETGQRNARKPLSTKPTNKKISASRQKELDDVVERIRARPGPKKSLYVLRRETPLEDGVQRTRSGRLTIKPLAYWKNEGIEYDFGDGSGAGLQDGDRFPMNSIKEIIRQEEKFTTPKARGRGRKPTGKTNAKGKARQEDTEFEAEEVGADDDEDPDADDWELNSGTLRAPVGVWDPELQMCPDEEQEQDIAYAAAAISTKEVKGQSFQYAKLVSTTFFGTGLVELPPGGLKKAKNSRKMHMSFFVSEGRVTVEVGSIQGAKTRFSIGRGGFWQVPRGMCLVMTRVLMRYANL